MDPQPPPDSARRRLLFVDDEPRIVDGLRKSLRQYRQHWEVETTTSGAEALLRLEGAAFDALVTDAHMPLMDGEGLLRTARESWPQMLRVVLSGDIAQSGHARLVQLAHQFIPKPVEVPVLHARIEEALAARHLLGSAALKALVCRLGTLPALPGTFGEVNRLLERADATLDQFVHVVEADPSVCANVLRVVNSAWFGLRTRVASIREAIRLLGFRPLRDVVLAAEVFSGASPTVERLRREALERLGALPKLLRALQADEWKEAAATAVILADVGQLIVLLRAPAEAAAVETEVARGWNRLEVETRLLGADHALLGAVLLTMWSFPSELIEAVALHHAARTVTPVRSLSTVLALSCTVQDLGAASGAQREALCARARALAAPFGVEDLESLTSAFVVAKQEAA